MEVMSIEFAHGFLIATQLVQQRDVLEQEVVALRHEFGIALEVVEAELVWTLHALVELVELHEDTGIVFVKVESPLHTLQGLLPAPLLVESCQGEVAPDGGELRIEACCEFPILNSNVVLSLVVVKAAKVVRCTGTLGIHLFGYRENHYVLQAIGEAIVWLNLFCLLEVADGFLTQSLTQFEVA